MAGDNYKRVTQGSPARFTARWFNRTCDVLEDFDRSQQNVDSSNTPTEREGLILVRNDSGVDVDRYQVLGIADVIFDPDVDLAAFQNEWAISGAKPTTADYTGYFVVTWQPIKNGEIGRAFIFGIVTCKVNIVTEGDQFADVSDNDVTKLKSDTFSGSAQILYPATGTGTVQAIVRLGNTRKGFTGTSTRYGAVTWDGTDLKQEKNTVTYKDGLLVDVGDTEYDTIDTPDPECP